MSVVKVGGKKRNFYLLLIFLFVLSLVGCGMNQNAQNDTEILITQLPTLAVETSSSTAAGATQTLTPKPTQYNPTTPPSVTPVIVFENPVIIFKGLGPAWYIVDIMDGDGRPLQTSGEIVFDILTWNEACKIIARMESGIAEINLHGEVVHYIFNNDQLPDSPEGAKGFLKPSPDEQWLSYRLGLGEYHEGFDFLQSRHEFEYLLIQSIHGNQGQYQVSNGGSTIIWAWSPDSRRLAYDDIDETGIHQVYVVNPDGSRRYQLTNFVIDYDIEGLKWSPDSKQLAIEYWLSEDGSKRDTLIVTDEEHQQITLFRNLHLLWWKDEDTLLVFERQGVLDGVIKQLDVGSNQIIGRAHVDTSGRNLIPFGSRRKVGFLNSDGVLSVYDTERHTVTIFPNTSYDKPEIRNYLEVLDYMITSPDSFSGESACPGW